MPIEINELIIRATVGDDTTAADGAGQAKDHLRSDGESAGGLSPAELERVVDVCVKRVLQILNEAREK